MLLHIKTNVLGLYKYDQNIKFLNHISIMYYNYINHLQDIVKDSHHFTTIANEKYI